MWFSSSSSPGTASFMKTNRANENEKKKIGKRSEQMISRGRQLRRFKGSAKARSTDGFIENVQEMMRELVNERRGSGKNAFDGFVRVMKSYKITRVSEDDFVEITQRQRPSSGVVRASSSSSSSSSSAMNGKGNARGDDESNNTDNSDSENKYTLMCAQTYETDRETRDMVSMEIAKKGALLGSLMMEKVLEYGWWDEAVVVIDNNSLSRSSSSSSSSSSTITANALMFSRRDDPPELEFQALKSEKRKALNVNVMSAIEEQVGKTTDFDKLVSNIVEKIFTKSSNIVPDEISLSKAMKEDIIRDISASPKVTLYKNTLLYLSKNEDEFSRSSSKRDFSIQAEFQGVSGNDVHPLAVVTMSIIEDMSVAISEAIAKAMLSTNAFSLVSNLKSSRILNKFRNQQRFSKFLFHNYHDVENIFSDKFELYGYYAQTDQLTKRTLFMQRVGELEKLKGLRLFVSLVLEALDVFVPLLFQAWKNGTKFATYLLVVILGRSIGLVYRGIKDVVDDSTRPRRNGGLF